MIGVALDGPGLAATYVSSTAVPWDVAAPSDRESASRLGVPYVPTILLVDSDAIVQRTWTGLVEEATTEEVITAARDATPGR